MENLHQPKPVSLVGDLGLNWKRFKKAMLTYMVASGASSKPLDVQAALWLHCMGEETVDILDNLGLSEQQKKDPNQIISQLEGYFTPQTNISIKRHQFNTRLQQEGESFAHFLNDLRKVANECDFGTLKDDLIRDRIVCAVRDKRVKDRLLRESSLTLTKTVEICQAAEQSNQDIGCLMQPNLRVSVVNKQKQQARTPTMKNSHEGRQQKSMGGKKCPRCGREAHNFENCPAKGRQCYACKGYNHFGSMCRARKQQQRPRNVSTVEQAEEGPKEDGPKTYVLDCIGRNLNAWFENCKIIECNKTVRFKLDSGADCNVIPKYIFDTLNITDALISTNDMATNYEGKLLKVLGKCSLTLLHRNVKYKLDFLVIQTDKGVAPVLGRDSSSQLGLIVRNNSIAKVTMKVVGGNATNKVSMILAKYEDIFSGIGSIKGEPCNFKLKENYQAKIVPSRKVSFQLIEPLKRELNNMISDGIITRVTEPSEFVHPVVIVKKKNSNQIRLCLDPKYLNDALMREHYYLPTFEDLTYDMSGSQFFSVLDANKGFYQVNLSAEASNLTVFATPIGRFKFLRLPFGVKVAPEIFHRTFSNIFGDIPGVKIYIDDIIIYAKSLEDHNQILETVLKRARDSGVKFNKEKSKILKSEIKYVGHIFSKDGIKPDMDKIEAIKQVPRPENKDKLRQFLGMVTYVSKFIPNLSQISYNLRQLIKKDNVYDWQEIHEKEFCHLKQILMESPVLQYYNPEQPITLSVDSSKNGMGAVILQNGGPIAYASKCLTETQEKYSQIEKETLAILFGCKKFHQYLYGNTFIIESDHQPLETIFKKTFDKIPLRLQRMILSLQNYDFQVKYKPGKHLYFADALSRSSYNDKNCEIDEAEIESQMHLVNMIEISPQKYDYIKNETANDKELQELTRTVLCGWPSSKKELNDYLKPYWPYRDEISEFNGVLFKANRIIIPKSLRGDILDKLHYNHLGIDKTIARSQELVFWPFITSDITNKVKSCTTCMQFQNSQVKESIIERELPSRPWQTLGVDLFELKGNTYLLVVDYFSKYPELALLNSSPTFQVVQELKAIFSRHGKPDIIFSDNGPQFSSYEFRSFVKEWQIIHKTSTPTYAQSNGFIERHVQTIKRLIKKVIIDRKDIALALLEYRNTPLSTKEPSPAELLFGRKIKGIIPIKQELLKPKYDIESHKTNLKCKQTGQRNYYNKSFRNLPDLQVNDFVLMQHNQLWKPGKIVAVDSTRPRSYVVKLNDSDRTYIRNRKFLRKIDSNFISDEQFNTLIDYHIANSEKERSNVCNDEYVNTNLAEAMDSSMTGSCLSNQEQLKSAESVTQTRSGRCIKKPIRFKDFV